MTPQKDRMREIEEIAPGRVRLYGGTGGRVYVHIADENILESCQSLSEARQLVLGVRLAEASRLYRESLIGATV